MILALCIAGGPLATYLALLAGTTVWNHIDNRSTP